MSDLTSAPGVTSRVGRTLPRRLDPDRDPARTRRAQAGQTALRLAPLLLLYVLICATAQPSPLPVRDEYDLLAAASRLLDGRLVPPGEVLDPRAYLWHGPGLPALLAPLLALDVRLPVMRFIEPVLMIGAAAVFHRLLRMRLAPWPALAWTYAFGLYAPFFSVVPQLHKEPLAVLLVVAGMLALARALETGRRRFVLGAGLALTALTMVRLEYGWVALVLLAVALAFALRRHGATARRLAAVAAIAVAGCLPWLGYTYALTGKPLYWGTSSGLSLFWMSPTLPGETGQWHDPPDVARDPALAAYRPLFERLARLDPVASDRWLREQAIANMRERPVDYARNVAANVSRLLFSTPMRPLEPRAIVTYSVSNTLLFAGVGWAAVVLWRRRRRLPPEVVPIALFAALAVAVHVPPSASPRMLLPIAPALLWLIALAAHGGARHARRSPSAATPAPATAHR